MLPIILINKNTTAHAVQEVFFMSDNTALRSVPFESLLETVIPQLSKGAFLVCGNKDNPNPMTIGWCMFGQVWSKPVALVLVRHSRYSHSLMDDCETFGISFPKEGELPEALSYCGRVSGRDADKFKDLNLMPIKIEDDIMGVSGCYAHFACRKVFVAESSLVNMDKDIINRYYADFNIPEKDRTELSGDPHTLYFGEILSAKVQE